MDTYYDYEQNLRRKESNPGFLSMACDFYTKYCLPIFPFSIIIFSIADGIIQIKYKYIDILNIIASVLIIPLAIYFLTFMLRCKNLQNKGLAIASGIISPLDFGLRLTGYILNLVKLLKEEKPYVHIENLMVTYFIFEFTPLMLIVFYTCK